MSASSPTTLYCLPCSWTIPQFLCSSFLPWASRSSESLSSSYWYTCRVHWSWTFILQVVGIWRTKIQRYFKVHLVRKLHMFLEWSNCRISFVLSCQCRWSPTQSLFDESLWASRFTLAWLKYEATLSTHTPSSGHSPNTKSCQKSSKSISPSTKMAKSESTSLKNDYHLHPSPPSSCFNTSNLLSSCTHHVSPCNLSSAEMRRFPASGILTQLRYPLTVRKLWVVAYCCNNWLKFAPCNLRSHVEWTQVGRCWFRQWIHPCLMSSFPLFCVEVLSTLLESSQMSSDPLKAVISTF